MRTEPASKLEPLIVASRPDEARLVNEVAEGLRTSAQAWLPAAWLYDERGCALFDRICELPEYYPTRTERRLLSDVGEELARLSGADELVEIGSGLARKTPVLLKALGAARHSVRYVPFDVSDVALLSAADHLLREFPSLAVQPVQGDFTEDLSAIPSSGRRRLVAFLGGTIGNFTLDEAREFIAKARALLSPGDTFLLAADLVKETSVLNAAYNDAAGVTAAFCLNALARLERDLGAELTLGDFRHDAFFAPERRRIEMHARAKRRTRICIPRLGFERTFAEDESISTEISRKYTVEELERLMCDAGLVPVRTWTSETPYALVLAKRD